LKVTPSVLLKVGTLVHTVALTAIPEDEPERLWNTAGARSHAWPMLQAAMYGQCGKLNS